MSERFIPNRNQRSQPKKRDFFFIFHFCPFTFLKVILFNLKKKKKGKQTRQWDKEANRPQYRAGAGFVTATATPNGDFFKCLGNQYLHLDYLTSVNHTT